MNIENQNEAKAIIEKHMKKMLDEIGSSSAPIGWVGKNAPALLTEIVFNTMCYGVDVEQYMKSEDMLKD